MGFKVPTPFQSHFLTGTGQDDWDAPRPCRDIKPFSNSQNLKLQLNQLIKMAIIKVNLASFFFKFMEVLVTCEVTALAMRSLLDTPNQEIPSLLTM